MNLVINVLINALNINTFILLLIFYEKYSEKVSNKSDFIPFLGCID